MTQAAGSRSFQSMEPYSVTLELVPAGAPGSPVFDVSLRDHQVAGTAQGDASLDFADWRAVLSNFLRGEVVRHVDARAFGTELATRLLGQRAVKQTWDRALQRRNGRPVRLELVLPAVMPGVDAASGIAIEELPFELMVGSDGEFWFRQPGWSLVRTFAGLPERFYLLPARSLALLAWANPLVPNDNGEVSILPPTIFEEHEAAFHQEAASLGMTVLPPCRRATREELSSRLSAASETPLLSLVAHGEGKGGALLLHADAGTDEPESVLARDLGAMCKTGGVRVALLWSCHSAKRHVLRSSVVAALLHPDQGDLAAVVASHAALIADRTPLFGATLLRSLRRVAAGDLERAVAAARHALPEDDVQWAAPVYYARPLQGRSVTLEQAIEESLAELTASPGRQMIIGAPEARSWFRGRQAETSRALGKLKTHRLVTLTGMPGIGKTALAIAVSHEAMAESSLAFQAGYWLELSTKTSTVALREELTELFRFKAEQCPTVRALAQKMGEQRVLLVLDNAEDLLSTDGAGFRSLLDTLLRYAPGLRLLLTSRRAVGHLDGAEEDALPVGRLVPGVDHEVFVAVAGGRLVAEHADPATVNALVEALHGHPQSIVLVAGQVGRGLSLSELKVRVESEDADVVSEAAPFDQETEETDEKLRTRRLVSSLNLSFTPLFRSSPLAAEVFVWLATFPVGLPQVLLREIFGDDANRLAGRLLALNMVELSDSDQRFFLPGPIRWYALKKQEIVISPSRHAVLEERTSRAIKTLMAFYLSKKPDDDARHTEIKNLHYFVSHLNRKPASSVEVMENLRNTFDSYLKLPMNPQQLNEALNVGSSMQSLFSKNNYENTISIENSLRELRRQCSEGIKEIGAGVDNS